MQGGRHATAFMLGDQARRWEQEQRERLEEETTVEENTTTKQQNKTTTETTTKNPRANSFAALAETSDCFDDANDDSTAQVIESTKQPAQELKSETKPENYSNTQQHQDMAQEATETSAKITNTAPEDETQNKKEENLNNESVEVEDQTRTRTATKAHQDDDNLSEDDAMDEDDDADDDEDWAWDDENGSMGNKDDYDEFLNNCYEEDKPILLPDPPQPQQPTMQFHTITTRVETILEDTFHPIATVKGLLEKLQKNPAILGLEGERGALVTTRNMPTEEEKFNAIVQSDYTKLSPYKYRMTLIFTIATKDEITIQEIKTPTIIQHLTKNKLYMDKQKYSEIATSEVGFFSRLHTTITNRDELREYITNEYDEDNDMPIPTFEVYNKTTYCRMGGDRAYAPTITIKCGRSDAQKIKDFLCTLDEEGAFGQAQFIPQGLERSQAKVKLHALYEQNKYMENTTAIPINGLNRHILSTVIQTNTTTMSLEDYLLTATKAERIEKTKTNDRWLLVLDKTDHDAAVKFIDEMFHDIFQNNNLPKHPTLGIPFRPGSRHSRSAVVNNHTESLLQQSGVNAPKKFAKPPQYRRPTTLKVSYAAVAATKTHQSPGQQAQSSPKQQQKGPVATMNKVRNEVKQQVTQNEAAIRADLESQVRSLTAQIEALKEIVQSLVTQMQLLTNYQHQTPPNTPQQQDNAPATNKTTTTAMEVELAGASPRTPAAKRARHNNKSEGTTGTHQDSTKTEKEAQKTPSDATKTQDSSMNLLTQPALTHSNESEPSPRFENPQTSPSAQPAVTGQSDPGLTLDSQDLTVLETKQSDGTTSL